MKTDTAGEEGKDYYLPDFCTSRATLAIVLIVELTAFVLALSHWDAELGFWRNLSRLSLFLVWIGLTGAALLCALNRVLRRLSAAQVSMAVLAIIMGLVALVSLLASWAGRTAFAEELGIVPLFPRDQWGFVLRNMAISLVITTLALRYFYVAHEWQRNVEMQARARVHALQARIRPHFLFNSMNTIASLTRSDPALAEQAVQDLADLFRANLSEQRNTITLAQELEVARIYQRIEELRLGERLRVVWNINQLPMQAIVPGLLLQPLLENAIYHGVEPMPLGGVVQVSGELSGGNITIVVRNAVSDRQNYREGNKLALANIRERLELMYGERALVKAGRFDHEYIVTLRFPHVEDRTRLTA
ncbi:MAG TPA: sensor histidine kinase [Steroidobacteraceae bacterium]|jgi:two-component system sensor histidine kinase AlgZ|nr:sensor histidine kinase [Steroidobacteraceae bacterium]